MEEIKFEDYQFDIFRPRDNMLRLTGDGFFVRVTHKPTGVTMTEYDKSSLQAKTACVIKLQNVLKKSGLYF